MEGVFVLSAKRDRWRIRAAVAVGVLALLLLMVAVVLMSTDVQARVSTLAVQSVPTVQPIPIEDATVTALNKQKLLQEVKQLENQNEPDLLGWLRMNAPLLLSTLVVVIGGLVGLWRWLGDRRGEREKRAEERFQSAVTGLGDEKEGAQIGAAILLRTFLRKGYEQFYVQTFDLAVANLRRRGASKIVQHQLWDAPQNLDTTLPLTTLDQALIVVFKEAFPLARGQEKREPAFLDATGVQLDNAYLVGADLKQIWGPQASLRKANLSGANLSAANLTGACLSGTHLSKADLSRATLDGADLSGADLDEANLSGANLSEANLTGARLVGADLRVADLAFADLSGAALFGANLLGANLFKADLSGAILWGVTLYRADLSAANLFKADLRRAILVRANLSGANLSKADLAEADLAEADLRRAEGLTDKQRATYKAQGALVDEKPASNVSQEPVSTSPPLEPESVPPTSTQETLPTPDASQSNGMSSQVAPDQGTSGEAEKGDEGGRTPEKHRERDDRSPGK